MNTASNKPSILAISGVKNSGKTTLITKLIPLLSAYGLKVATIKHTTHEINLDVPGTDTWKHQAAGAYGTAVFSNDQFLLIKKQPNLQLEQLIQTFPEADLILLEGFKSSDYPKLELIRRGNSSQSICCRSNLLGIVTDIKKEELQGFIPNVPLLDLNNAQAVAESIIHYTRNRS